MYGCKHYLRKCSIYAECCKKTYQCIHCHNIDNNHDIQSIDIKNIVCDECGKKQKPKEKCEDCYIYFGDYFCEKCIIFDDTKNKEIVHCNDCGICRVTYGKKLYHCDKCNMCAFSKHEKCYKIGDCPICCESLHKSINSATLTKCNHWIHNKCLEELLKKDYKCPICMKTVIPIDILEKIMDLQVNSYILPDDYKNMDVNIKCIDCEEKSIAKFHIVAMKCPKCRSYNTIKN